MSSTAKILIKNLIVSLIAGLILAATFEPRYGWQSIVGLWVVASLLDHTYGSGAKVVERERTEAWLRFVGRSDVADEYRAEREAGTL